MPGTAVRAHVRHRLAALMRPTPVVFTDSQGRWRTPVLPAADIELGLRLWHADVGAPMYVAQPSLSELAAGTSRIAMVGTELDVHRAAQLGKVDWLRQALAREPVLVRRQQDRHTPLHIAARFDRPEVVDVLVEAGADLEDMGPGSTALHDAVEFGSLAVARRLLERGANPDTRNVADSAPFHHAIWAQSDGLCTAAELLASVELLVEYGADVNAVHRGVGTPLDYALRVAPQPVVAALTRHGAHTSE
jgi:hypothetical protein